MSEQHVEMMRRRYESFNAFMRGDLSVEAYMKDLDPEVEVVWRERTYPDFPARLHGLREVIAFAEQFRDGWTDVIAEPLEVVAGPENRVLAFVRQSSRGRQSQVPIVIHFFEVWTVRDRKVARVEYYRRRADALAAAGLAD